VGAATDIHQRVVRINDAKFTCGCWHQLGQAPRACRTGGELDIPGFCENQGVEEARWQPMLTFSAHDSRPPFGPPLDCADPQAGYDGRRFSS
jgi:hypothetical protein